VKRRSNQVPSFRDGPKDQIQNFEIPSSKNGVVLPLLEEFVTEEEEQKEIARLTAIIENQKKAESILRASYKWFLDFIRNCMVVAALFYLAKQSGSWMLYAVTATSGFALAGYCWSQVEEVWPTMNTANMSQRKMKLSIGASVLALQLIGVGITVALVVTINKIVDVQITMAKAH
jgi:hypothetical protein